MFRKKAKGRRYTFQGHRFEDGNVVLRYYIESDSPEDRPLVNSVITVVLPEKEISLERVLSELRDSESSLDEMQSVLGPIYDHPTIVLKD